MTGWADRDRVASLLAAVEGYLDGMADGNSPSEVDENDDFALWAAAQANQEFIELKELTRSRISDLESEIRGWRERDQRTADAKYSHSELVLRLETHSIYLCTWEDWKGNGFVGTMAEIWEAYQDLENDKEEEEWHEYETGLLYSTYSWDKEGPDIGSVIINDNMRIKCIRRGDL